MVSNIFIPCNQTDCGFFGCTWQFFFCFFQQKIEWVWLYEQHPERFAKAMEYEKDGYTWCQDETLSDLIRPERIQKIKEEFLKRSERTAQSKSPYLLEILGDAEGEGCAACFI